MREFFGSHTSSLSSVFVSSDTSSVFSPVVSVSVELEGIGTANNKLCNAAEANNIDGETCRKGMSKLFRRNDLIIYLALGIWIAQHQEKLNKKQMHRAKPDNYLKYKFLS